jgi:hypothetical protein
LPGRWREMVALAPGAGSRTLSRSLDEAFGSTQQEHLYAGIRLLAAMTSGAVGWQVGWSVPSLSTGEPTKLPAPSQILAWGSHPPALRKTLHLCLHLSDVFRHDIALVRIVTECLELAAWAPDDVRPRGDPHITSWVGRGGLICSRRGLGLRRGRLTFSRRGLLGFLLLRACRTIILAWGRAYGTPPGDGHADDGCLEPCLTRAMQLVLRAQLGYPSANMWGGLGGSGSRQVFIRSATFS